jgi:hypothetical protein
MTVKLLAGVLPKSTVVALDKLFPKIVTMIPPETDAEAGDTPVMIGVVADCPVPRTAPAVPPLLSL